MASSSVFIAGAEDESAAAGGGVFKIRKRSTFLRVDCSIARMFSNSSPRLVFSAIFWARERSSSFTFKREPSVSICTPLEPEASACLTLLHAESSLMDNSAFGNVL